MGVLQMKYTPKNTKTLQGKIQNIKFNLDFLFFLGHFVQMFHKLGDFSLELLIFASFTKTGKSKSDVKQSMMKLVRSLKV